MRPHLSQSAESCGRKPPKKPKNALDNYYIDDSDTQGTMIVTQNYLKLLFDLRADVAVDE